MTDPQQTPTSEAIKENLANTNSWLRLLLIVIYALIFTLGTWVLGFVVLLVMLILLFTGERNRNLTEFGGQLAAYLAQIMRYATLNTDTKPFPFGDWAEQTAADAAPSAEIKAAPKKKKAKRKATKKAPPPSGA